MEGMLSFIAGLSVALIALVLVSVRRQHVRVEYSVSWLAVALALLLVSRSHLFLDELARRLDIDPPPLALMLMVGCLFLMVLFRLSVILSSLKDSNIALAQRVAILEYMVQSKEDEQEKARP